MVTRLFLAFYSKASHFKQAISYFFILSTGSLMAAPALAQYPPSYPAYPSYPAAPPAYPTAPAYPSTPTYPAAPAYPAPTPGPLVPLDRPATPPAGELTPLDRPVPQNPVNSPRFTFTSALDYGDCVEVILRLYDSPDTLTDDMRQHSCYAEIERFYGSGGLTQQQALSLISAADFYATNLLSNKLYPLRGQRMRVAEFFGFIYGIDQNDSAIRDMATPMEPGRSAAPLPNVPVY